MSKLTDLAKILHTYNVGVALRNYSQQTYNWDFDSPESILFVGSIAEIERRLARVILDEIKEEKIESEEK